MTDDFFTSYDIRGTTEDDLPVETAWNVGKAVGDWLPTYGKVVVIAGEGAGRPIFDAIIEGLRLQGRDVLEGAGDKTVAKQRIEADGLSGGVFVGHDEAQDVSVVEVFNDKAKLVGSENGLPAIAELVEAGNFVPSASKGELTSLA